MVIKTEVCAFCEDRIYPGHGSRLVRRDGQVLIFIDHKSSSLYLLRKKPAKLTWTVAWRRLNKKFTSIEKSARRRRGGQAARSARAVVGVDAAALRSKRKANAAAGGKLTYAQKVAAREAKRRAARQAGSA